MTDPVRAAALPHPQAANPRALTWTLLTAVAASALVALAIRIAVALASPGLAPTVAPIHPAHSAPAVAQTPPRPIARPPTPARTHARAPRRKAPPRARPRRHVSLDEDVSTSDLLDDAAAAGMTSKAPARPRLDDTP